MGNVNGRADTPKKKAEVIGRISRASGECHSLCLGQFIDNAIATSAGPDLFDAEDDALAVRCESYARSTKQVERTQPGNRRD